MVEETTPTIDSPVSLREITQDTVIEIINLSNTLSDAQRKMVADNAKSIAQAHFSKHAWFRAIYAGETAVGFVMLYDNPEEQEYYLWRLMIAGPHQGKGYGRRAIELLLDYVRTRPGVRELLTSCGGGEASPEGFYRSLGFERDGKMYDEEIGLRLPIL